MSTVNERLRDQLTFMQAQVTQFRLIVGVLVHRLGAKQSICEADFEAMRSVDAMLTMTPKPAPDGNPAHDALEIEVVTGEEAKRRQAEAPRIVAPSSIITP